MSAVVIDTNVLLVANGAAPQMSDACRLACMIRLEQTRMSQAIVIDRQFFILGEYKRKVNPNQQPPGPGDAFVRHVLQNMANPSHVAQVDLTPTNAERTDFQEFPNDEVLRAAFDPADRKFVAASNAHPDKPPILESADSKWLGWEEQLSTHGIRLEILCRKELESISARKTQRR